MNIHILMSSEHRDNIDKLVPRYISVWLIFWAGIVLGSCSAAFSQDTLLDNQMASVRQSQFKVVCQESLTKSTLEGYGYYINKEGWAVIPGDIGDGFVEFTVTHNDKRQYECIDIYHCDNEQFLLIRTDATADSITPLRLPKIVPEVGDTLYAIWPHQQAQEQVKGRRLEAGAFLSSRKVDISQVYASIPLEIKQIGALAVNDHGEVLGVLTLEEIKGMCLTRMMPGYVIQEAVDKIIAAGFPSNKPYAVDKKSEKGQTRVKVAALMDLAQKPRFLEPQKLYDKVCPCVATVIYYDFYGEELSRSYGILLPDGRNISMPSRNTADSVRREELQKRYDEQKNVSNSRRDSERSRGRGAYSGRENQGYRGGPRRRSSGYGRGSYDRNRGGSISTSPLSVSDQYQYDRNVSTLILHRDSLLQAHYVDVIFDGGEDSYSVEGIMGENPREGWVLAVLSDQHIIKQNMTFLMSLEEEPFLGCMCPDYAKPDEWIVFNVEFEAMDSKRTSRRTPVSSSRSGWLLSSPETIPFGSLISDPFGRVFGVCNNVREGNKVLFTPLASCKSVQQREIQSIKQWREFNRGSSARLAAAVFPSAVKREPTDSILKSLGDVLCEVVAYDSRGVVLRKGSGFMINAFGHCITSFSLLEGSDRVTVRYQGKDYENTCLVAFNRGCDIAQLEFDVEAEQAAYLPLTTGLLWGDQTVFVGGYVKGIIPAFLCTEITHVHKQVYKGPDIRRYDTAYFYDTDVSLADYYAGSPVLNLRGEVVGCVCWRNSGRQGVITSSREIYHLKPLSSPREISEDIWGLKAVCDFSKAYRTHILKTVWFSAEGNRASSRSGNSQEHLLASKQQNYNSYLDSLETQVKYRRSLRYPGGINLKPGIYEFCGHLFTENELGFVLQEWGITTAGRLSSLSLEDYIWSEYCRQLERSSLGNNMYLDDVYSDGTGYVTCPLCRGRGYLVFRDDQYIYPDPPEVSNAYRGGRLDQTGESQSVDRFIPFAYPSSRKPGTPQLNEQENNSRFRNDGRIRSVSLNTRDYYPYVQIDCPAQCCQGKIISPSASLLPWKDNRNWQETCVLLYQLIEP